MSANVSPIALTAGEPAGIGPDCVLQLAAEQAQPEFIVIADQQLLAQRAQQLNIELPIYSYQPGQAWPPQQAGLYVKHVPLAAAVDCGYLNPANVPYVLKCIQLAVIGCRQGHYHAMVTAPVHKGVINDAGIAFSGHTEWIAQLLDVADPVMLLVSNQLRVALVTTHLPLAAVSAAITAPRLISCIQTITRDLQLRFGILQPRISVCGLNPHAGEGGHLGLEEIEIIVPTLQALRQQGYQLSGPVPADTAFVPEFLTEVDVVLAMYHDQGLPVIKSVAFDTAVNVTLGLPIIRTSVDHGTALSLAGTGRAHSGSLRAALTLAQQLRR